MASRSTRRWWLLVPAGVVLVAAWGAWWFVDRLSFGNASPLHRAIILGQRERAARLIASGSDVDATMYSGLHPATWGATPLHLAARRDQTEVVEALLRAGAHPNAADHLGFTPLHAALQEGANGAAIALIRAGAAVRSSTTDGKAGYALENCGQPIRTALQTSSIATVRALIDAGADPAEDIGEDAMAYADAPDLLPKLELMIARGLSVEGVSSMGRAIHRAAAADDAAAIEFLLDRGAEIEARGGDYGFTPLLAAAYAGSNRAVTTLVQRGADVRAGTPYFGSPIYAAAFSGHRETVRLLLSMHLNIDLRAGRASDGATPLHMAYWNHDQEMARMLIDAGADPTQRSLDGRTPEAFRR